MVGYLTFHPSGTNEFFAFDIQVLLEDLNRLCKIGNMYFKQIEETNPTTMPKMNGFKNVHMPTLS